MYHTKKSKNCSSFKAIEQDVFSRYKYKSLERNCKECIYFSSRNCGMDIADSIDPVIDLLC